ncbi:hypothetical protein QTP88_018113 [Uroleucon formosanum]
MRVTVVTIAEPPRPNPEAERRECTACTRASSPNLNSCREFRRDCLGECVLPALKFRDPYSCNRVREPRNIINDGMSENESHDVEQEEDSTDGVDEEKITLKEALQLANRLKTFCLNKSDAVSLLLVNQLQSNFEAIAIQEKNKLKFQIFFFNK